MFKEPRGPTGPPHQHLDPPCFQLLVVLSQLPQLQLKPGSLFGHGVQGLPGVGQLGLVGGLQARQLPGHLRLGLGDAQAQPGILHLQGTDFVDVDRQAVIEVTEVLLLLEPGDPVGGQWGVSASGSVFWRGHFHLKRGRSSFKLTFYPDSAFPSAYLHLKCSKNVPP